MWRGTSTNWHSWTVNLPLPYFNLDKWILLNMRIAKVGVAIFFFNFSKNIFEKESWKTLFSLFLRVYASQNGQKKGRSLKITKNILSQFLFHKKLSWHSYFSSRGLIQSQNHFLFEKSWPENLPPKKHASQNGQIWTSIIFWWRYFLNFYHHRVLENLLKNGVIT